MSMAGVVLASGQGCFRNGVPKVLEKVGTRPMLVGIVETVLRAGFDPCIVTVNPRFHGQIADALAGVSRVHFAVQEKRRGAADAVRWALSGFRNGCDPDFLAVYGDMPLWAMETMVELAKGHHMSRAVLSMVSVALDGTHPKTLEGYGRIRRDAAGRVRGVVEKGDASPAELASSTTINPSLWMFNRAWFERWMPSIVPTPRGDGHPAEYYLPPLVRMAYESGRTIFELPLSDALQAIGVNKLSELEEVRAIFASRSL